MFVQGNRILVATQTHDLGFLLQTIVRSTSGWQTGAPSQRFTMSNTQRNSERTYSFNTHICMVEARVGSRDGLSQRGPERPDSLQNSDQASGILAESSIVNPELLLETCI